MEPLNILKRTLRGYGFFGRIAVQKLYLTLPKIGSNGVVKDQRVWWKIVKGSFFRVEQVGAQSTAVFYVPKQHWQQIEDQIHLHLCQVSVLHCFGRYQRGLFSNHCKMWQKCWFTGITESFERRSCVHILSRMCFSTRWSTSTSIYIHEKFGYSMKFKFSSHVRVKIIITL